MDRRRVVSTPVNHSIILLFSGASGQQYGYNDGWSDDGLFLYTGEGQHGDMEFVRANAAIRDHANNGEDLHLFLQVGAGGVRYEGQMVCTGYHQREAPDVDGNARQAIVFELVPLTEFEEEEQFVETPADLIPVGASLEELRQQMERAIRFSY